MKCLSAVVVTRVTQAFLEGDEAIDVEGLVTERGRDVDHAGIAELGAAARGLFADDPTASDPWLAVRLHALLRLTRREASTKEFWLHAAYVDAPDYVRWRWSKNPERYRAGDVNQAFSRLWWGAELFRVGADYGPVEGAFSPPDIPNTIMRLVAAHNRPFCAAVLRFVEERRTDGQPLIGRQVNLLSSAVNSQLFVAALDAVAPDLGTDPAAQEVWRASAVTAQQLFEEKPEGPHDLGDAHFSEKVAAVGVLLDRIADGAGIATADDPKAGSERPSDQTDAKQQEQDDSVHLAG